MLQSLLVAIQIGISLVLLAPGLLFIQTVRNLRKTPFGINPEGLLMFAVNPENTSDQRELTRVYGRLIQAVSTAPGVRSATIVSAAPLSRSMSLTVVVTDSTPPPRPGGTMDFSSNTGTMAQPVRTAAHMAATLGMSLIAGRDLTDADIDGPARHALINETMARSFWRGKNAIGRQFSFSYPFSADQAFEVVGIVNDISYVSLTDQNQYGAAYLPYTKMPNTGPMYFEVRAAGNLDRVASKIREGVSESAPDLPLYALKSQHERVDEIIVNERTISTLSSIFAALALALCCIGLYGLSSYSIQNRTREMGVRIALGAEPGDIIRLVLIKGVLIAGAGTAIGLAGVFASGRMIRSYLYGLSPRDPLTLAGATLVLLVVGLVAYWIPARRISKLDSTVALRHE